MDRFIARQPIFDRRMEVQGYELLFRSGLENAFGLSDQEAASSLVIVESLYLPGFESLTAGKLAFMNLTRRCLLRDEVAMLPAQSTVLELLESIEADDEVIEACRQYKGKGYRIALDDFVLRPQNRALLDVADIVKVDVLETTPAARAALARELRPRGITLLAEKVETDGTFRETLEEGYQLFQGYFFASPTVVTGRDIPALKLSYLRLLTEIHNPHLDLTALRHVIEREVGLSYKLLRYINAAYYGRSEVVGSILHALLLLGELEVKRWASTVALAGMTVDKPGELQTEALVRGRFCELLAAETSQHRRSSDLFLLGLLSLMEAMFDSPIEHLLEKLPLAEDVKHALLGEAGILRDILDLPIHYGRGNWEALRGPLERLQLEEDVLPVVYAEALHWSRTYLSGDVRSEAA
jgi:c-di-GMP-related signal transduction protein